MVIFLSKTIKVGSMKEDLRYQEYSATRLDTGPGIKSTRFHSQYSQDRLMTIFLSSNTSSCKITVLNDFKVIPTLKLKSITLNMKTPPGSSPPDSSKLCCSFRRACCFSPLMCFCNPGAQVA